LGMKFLRAGFRANRQSHFPWLALMVELLFPMSTNTT
jgi:hypothetical protein